MSHTAAFSLLEHRFHCLTPNTGQLTSSGFKHLSLCIHPSVSHSTNRRRGKDTMKCNTMMSERFFFSVPLVGTSACKLETAAAFSSAGKGRKEKRGKNGLLALFPPLCSWPPGLLCSLAPLCGSFPPVQPGALPQSAVQGSCCRISREQPLLYLCNNTGSLFQLSVSRLTRKERERERGSASL